MGTNQDENLKMHSRLFVRSVFSEMFSTVIRHVSKSQATFQTLSSYFHYIFVPKCLSSVSSVMNSIVSGSKTICIVHIGKRNTDRFDSPLVLLHSLNYNTMQL